MRRSAYAVAGAVGLGLALVVQVLPSNPVAAAPNPNPGARALTAIQNGAAIAHRDGNGKVRYLSTRAGHAVAQTNRSVSGTSAAARSNINDFAPLFGVNNPATDLKAVSTIAGPAGPIVRFQQTHNGVPVIGGQLVVSDNTTGALVAINGMAGDADAVSTVAAISADTAARDAVAATNTVSQSHDLIASTPVLSIYDPTLIGAPDPLGARLVYQVTVKDPTAQQVNRYVLIDAATGRVALSFSQIESMTSTVCDYTDTPHPDDVATCPNPADGVAPDASPADSAVTDVRDAYDLTNQVNTFYNSVLGRAGIDGQNMDLISSVRFCYAEDVDPTNSDPTTNCRLDNAFWDGTQMVFGDGYAGADDVVAHELTHGVTQYTSGLLYYYQSGSINESISDVMGELFDQWNNSDTVVPGQDGPSFDWQIGEDLPASARTFNGVVEPAIRSMSNPGQYGQPDSMTSSLWSNDEYDAGGVHTDSGVGNKAAYLMAAGGTLNSVTVNGIESTSANWIQKVGMIWLGADQLLTPGANYASLANALQQSCQNLATAGTDGVNQTDCTAVSGAISATKMTGAPTVGGAIPQASTCGSGYTPVNAFSSNFNTAASQSLGTSWDESGLPMIDGEASPSTSAGNSLYIPEPYPDTAPSTQYVSTHNWITLSSTHTNYLNFQHLDSLDWFDGAQAQPTTSNYYLEGLFVDIDINGDTKGWLPLSSSTYAKWANGPTKTVYTSTFDGYDPIQLTGTYSGSAFGGDSRGWTSSQATLASSLNGKQVKFRFRVQTDGYDWASTAYGEWLDNVAVHYCVKPPTAPTSVQVKGYHTSATMTWAAASTNGGDTIKGYQLYRQAIGKDAAPVLVTTTSASARSYSFTGLKDAQDYKFMIRTISTKNVTSGYVTLTRYAVTLTMSASTTSVKRGSSVVFKGTMTHTDSKTAAAGSTIRLTYRKTGTTTWTTIASATTSSTGTFSFTVKPTASGTYVAIYSVGSTYNMGSGTPGITVNVV